MHLKSKKVVERFMHLDDIGVGLKDFNAYDCISAHCKKLESKKR
jgi:hypothetical protein